MVEGNAKEEGLPAEQGIKAFQLRIGFERGAIATVKLANFLEGEVFQPQSCAYVERRLVQVGNEEVSFSGVGHYHGEMRPGSAGIEGALIVPGAEEPKDLAGKGATEEAVHL